MSQTGYTPILIYSSSTGGNTPAAGNLTNSTLGSELAINITDGKLFYKDNANDVQVIGWKVVPATAGGTGQTSYAVGDILYASSTTALSKLADVATGNALISGGVNTAPSWGKIGLTTHISGTLPIANGGTNQTSFTGKSGNICGLVFYDGTSFQNDATVAHVGYDTVANTFYANNVNFSGSVTLASALPVAQGGTGTTTAFTAGSVVFAGASGVYSQDNANLFWDDTNNRLGLSATSPQRLLQLGTRGAVSTNAAVQVQNLTIGGQYNDSYNVNQWSFISWQFTANSDNDPFSVTPGSEAGKNWYMGPIAPTGYFQNGRFAFVSNGTEKLSIFSAGGVSIGNTTDPGAANLSVTKIFSNVTYSLSGVVNIHNDSSNYGITVGDYYNTTKLARFLNSSDTQVGSITQSGSSTAYNTTSDIRLKIDKGVSTSTLVIDNTVIHDFEWKSSGVIDKGVFAQEAYLVKPSAVAVGTDELNKNGDLETPWSVDYSKYVPDLIVYVQKLKEQSQKQQQIIFEMQQQIENLKGSK